MRGILASAAAGFRSIATVAASSMNARRFIRSPKPKQSDSRQGSLSFRGFRATSAAAATLRKGAAAVFGAHILLAGADMPVSAWGGGFRILEREAVGPPRPAGGFSEGRDAVARSGDWRTISSTL